MMQPIKRLSSWLEQYANAEHYLFTLQDLRALFPDLSDAAFKTLLSRSVGAGHLTRACRGIYVAQKVMPSSGLILFHIAALLRADEFNYISLETALSDVGVISQIPMNWITVMSSGRTHTICCGKFGSIEFIHTNQKPPDVMQQLSYDENRKLWRASVSLAIRDMKAAKRDCDLIDWDVVDELI
jgi:hypothetical protein